MSCHRFRANEVRLWLSVIAYNLGNLWRRLALPKRIDTWSLVSLQQRLVKTGGRLIKHARYFWLLLAEGHLTRRLFGRSCGGWRCCRSPRGSDGPGSCLGQRPAGWGTARCPRSYRRSLLVETGTLAEDCEPAFGGAKWGKPEPQAARARSS